VRAVNGTRGERGRGKDIVSIVKPTRWIALFSPSLATVPLIQTVE
jgi:hypothetical protein